MEGNTLETFKGSYEACIEARYHFQINELRGCLQKGMFERDSKEAVLARFIFIAEQKAMGLRLQQHTLQMRLQIAHAENASREVARWAITEISDEYSTELKSALDAQKFMIRENDDMHREELEVYKQA